MINKISKIKDYGIFEEFEWNAELQNFNRYNLLYGWNGTGKSTLCNLLSELTLDNKARLHPVSEWEIDSTVGPVRHNTADEASINIRVFNKAFVDKNVFTETHVKGIFYLSEEKIDEKENLKNKEISLKTKITELQSYEIELNGDKSAKSKKGLSQNNSSFLSEAAKNVKANFQVIDVDDKRLLNYDKTRLSAFIEKNENNIKSKSNRLTVSEIDTLSKSIRFQEKNMILDSDLKQYQLDQFNNIYQKVLTLCKTSIINKTISKLKENPAIAAWVYQGLKEFHNMDSDLCEFCGQLIPHGRILELNNHFSDEFEKLRLSLNEIISEIECLKLHTPFPASSCLYDEFTKTYHTATESCQETENKIIKLLDSWIEALKVKLQNPFNEDCVRDILTIDPEVFHRYSQSYNEILNLIRLHNDKLLNLQSEIEKAKNKLELHYVADQIAKYNYFEKKKREIDLSQRIDSCQTEINNHREEINRLKASLSNEVVSAEEFNEMLQKFIGRKELTLVNRGEGGYIIKRYGTDEAKNLSEGEKTAIGLVYFVVKLKENGNSIENTVVVFDDPISSLDSNHLFSAKSFIKNHCENSKQLFVFTHNFWFFKIMRDWFIYKKENIKGPDGKKQKDQNGKELKKDLFSIYQFSTKPDNGKRLSNIQNAKKELIKYDSEYHYLFARMQEYKDNANLSTDDCFSLANLVRRICEAALTFKYPHLRTLKGLIDSTSVDVQIKDRLYDFLNKYSHLDRIETHESLTENRIEEGIAIIDDVITLLKKELPEHYNNMCRSIN